MQEFPVRTSVGRWPPEMALRPGRVRGRSRNTTVSVRLAQSKENWHVKWRKSLSYSNKSQFPARNVFLTQEGGTLAVGLSSQTVRILLHCHNWMLYCQSEVPSIILLILWKETAPSEISWYPAFNWGLSNRLTIKPEAGDIYKYRAINFLIHWTKNVKE